MAASWLLAGEGGRLLAKQNTWAPFNMKKKGYGFGLLGPPGRISSIFGKKEEKKKEAFRAIKARKEKKDRHVPAYPKTYSEEGSYHAMTTLKVWKCIASTRNRGKKRATGRRERRKKRGTLLHASHSLRKEKAFSALKLRLRCRRPRSPDADPVG